MRPRRQPNPGPPGAGSRRTTYAQIPPGCTPGSMAEGSLQDNGSVCLASFTSALYFTRSCHCHTVTSVLHRGECFHCHHRPHAIFDREL
jgi:hypothetical protein